MTDDLLKGESEQTPPSSQLENKTQVSDSGDLLTDPGQQTQEEVEFNSLKGSTQDRIKKILRDKQDLESRLTTLEQSRTVVPPVNYPQSDANVKDALHKLSDLGVATDDKVDQKINQSLGALRFQFELDRLESKYNGEDGRPKFDRDEYNDYRNRHPEYTNYLPEDVYEKMYKEELSDFQSSAPQTKKTSSLKPTKASVGEEPLTPELIEQRLKEPDGRQWYERNVDKINRAMGKTG